MNEKNMIFFFDMMCTDNFYPKIMFPTRIAKRSHSLLDQIFCKVACKEHDNISSKLLRQVGDIVDYP